MQVTKGTWHMHKQCVLGSLSSSPAQELGNEATLDVTHVIKVSGTPPPPPPPSLVGRAWEWR